MAAVAVALGGLAPESLGQSTSPGAAQGQRRAAPPAPVVVAPRAPQPDALLAAEIARHNERTERANLNTATIVSGNPNGTYLFIAYDMATVLDDDEKLRILPVIGKGGYQNVVDLLHLRGVDFGITQSNILTYLRRTGEFGRGIEERLTYVAKLFNEEMHILAGPGIDKIEDLNGRIVNFSDIGSGTQFSTRLIFQLLGIKANEINVGQGDGYLKVKSGEIAATVLIAGKPSGAFQRFKLEPGMKLLSVPYAENLEDDYFPSKLTSDDYPTLIEKGKSVDTIAVGAVLAAYNWPRDSDRYRRVAMVVDAFFSKIASFQRAPRHPKWRETNLAATLQGWRRFPAAQEALEKLNASSVATAASVAAAAPAAPVASVATSRSDISLAHAWAQAARAAPNNPAERDRLFQEFLKWAQSQNRN